MRPLARVVAESTEMFLAFLCLLSSLAYLGGAPRPQSLDALLPGWLRLAWGLYLLFGGAAVLVALPAGWRRLEQAGLWLLAGPAGVYSLAVMHYGGVMGLFPAGVTLAFAAAFAVRASDAAQYWAARVLR